MLSVVVAVIIPEPIKYYYFKKQRMNNAKK